MSAGANMTHRCSRRTFLQGSAAVAGGLVGCASDIHTKRHTETWVNDVHSQLNPTRVAGIVRPGDVGELQEAIRRAHAARESVSVCGGRHAAGGQQFRSGRQLLDLSALRRVVSFDSAAGTIEVEAGIRWPAVLEFLHAQPENKWSIHQKQGGADELSLGGAVAANVHGRCLASRPIVQDVRHLSVVSPDGHVAGCDRERNREWFRHVVGGYGLFGIVHTVTLKLTRRAKLVRRVAWLDAAAAMSKLQAAGDAGAWHGDFQFSIVESRNDFCTAGLCSWYEPVAADRAVNAPSREALADRFRELIRLAHADKPRAMDLYRDVTLAADGKTVNWSDDWQRGDYVAEYHRAIDAASTSGQRGSEMLSELYVPRATLPDFLEEVARILRADRADLVYGVVRLIERDDETFLAWAAQPYACVILNLHTQHDAAAIARSRATFRRLLDAAIQRGGSYYLTYHRAARFDQTERCYPQFRAFLSEKRRLDPRETLDSDWYRHYRALAVR